MSDGYRLDAEDIPFGDVEEPFSLWLDDFIAAKSETPPALVGDETEAIVPAAGLVILFGKGGRGKTTFVVDAAFHWASGIAWHGIHVARPLRILFVENEGARELFRLKLAAKHASWEHEITGGIAVHTLNWGSLRLSDPEQTARLRTDIEAKQIDLVVGDPLDSLGLDGVGSPEDTRRFMALMTDVGLFRDRRLVAARARTQGRRPRRA